MKIKNTVTPGSLVTNDENYVTSSSVLHIDFSYYRDWLKSTCIKNKFTNRYSDNKHINNTMRDIFSKIFPHAQQNINKIIANNESHCHIISDRDKRDLCTKIIEKIHNKTISEEVELWQLGVTGEIRVIGSIIPQGTIYIFYPLFVDCHHLIYPNINGSNNHKDVKNSKKIIYS
ncbi:MAG: hypothetical protein L0L10_08635 [Tetragenococcus sp.]|nr:hypothetical protein [Tetragenococcus sp.]